MTTIVRGALGSSGCVAGGAAKVEVALIDNPMVTTANRAGFTACPLLSSEVLRDLPFGKAFNAFGEAVLLNQLRPPYLVFWLGGELGIAAFVEIESHNLGEPVAPHIQALPLFHPFEEVQLMTGELEELAVVLAIERRIGKKEKRCAGVHDAVGVFAQVVGRLANERNAAQILAHGLDRSQGPFQKLLVLH